MDRHPDDRVVTFPQPLIRGTIVRRPNRFIIEVDLDGQVVPCHCPTTGRIGNLVLDGLPCLLSDSHSTTRKTRYTVEAITVDTAAPDPMWIGINQNAANRYIEAALTGGALDHIVPVTTVQREQPLGLSRLDFLVNGNTYIEVKTPLQNLQILLPAGTATRNQLPFDATDRLVKHITELGHSLPGNQRAVMLLCFLYDNPGFQPQASARHHEVVASVVAAIAQGVEIWQTNLLIDPSGVRVGNTSNITTRFA
jgi:sugar fermentation stimulation protein A